MSCNSNVALSENYPAYDLQQILALVEQKVNSMTKKLFDSLKNRFHTFNVTDHNFFLSLFISIWPGAPRSVKPEDT